MLRAYRNAPASQSTTSHLASPKITSKTARMKADTGTVIVGITPDGEAIVPSIREFDDKTDRVVSGFAGHSFPAGRATAGETTRDAQFAHIA